MKLQNKIAIVTGASSGIGASFSAALIDEGATVYGLARSTDKLESIRSKIGDQFIPVTLDITDHETIDEWVDSAFDEENRPDILINNAGLGLFGDVDEQSLEDWHTMINTNLNGVFYITRKVVPHLKKNPENTHIINIASIAGLLGNPSMSGYNASKFGLRGFSEALFKELRHDGIKVTSMFPGSIATNFFDNTPMDTHDYMMDPEEVAETVIFLLKTSDNYLINELTLRPLKPKPKD